MSLSSLALLLEPLSLLWLFLLAMPILRWRKQQPWRGWLLLAGLYSLLTCTAIGHSLVFRLERPWVRWEWDSLPQNDVVLCLGGGISPSDGEITGVDLISASDRVTTSVELVRKGKGKALVISGGMSRPGEASESQTTFDWIQRWNLITAPAMPLGHCVNTRDEAVKMQELMKEKGWRTLTLVTSASHMRRAKATFEKAGLQVTPVACACQSDADDKVPEGKLFHLPNPVELIRISEWLHEELGYIVYWLKGWV
jgi:uncharacterized SAM-binding protein YcdF (DUF218 family)